MATSRGRMIESAEDLWELALRGGAISKEINHFHCLVFEDFDKWDDLRLLVNERHRFYSPELLELGYMNLHTESVSGEKVSICTPALMRRGGLL